jgi:N utilization substance protein A
MKGMRVQSIIRELRGEKIDIIEYSEDPVTFATHALSPAKISRVTIVNALEKHMEVIVDDSQLSLAIGKKGQNVRLAAKLLGWKVDIKSEEEKRQEVESAMAALVNPPEPVSALIGYGMGEELAARLTEAGVGTIDKLGGMTPEQLQEIPGVDPEMVENIRDSVTAYYGQFEEPAPAAAPEEGAAEAEAVQEFIAEGAPASEPEPEAPGGVEAVAPAEAPAAVREAQDIEMAGESDTIVDSGRVSHDESEAGSSQNE